jgi:hypothetical protein
VITLYIKVELDASLWFGTCTNAPLMLEMRLGRRKETELRVVTKSSYNRTVYLSTPLVGHILKTHDKESPQSLRTFH